MITKTIHTPHFVSIPLRDGELLDLAADTHSTTASGWGHHGQPLLLGSGATHYCFVLNGSARVTVTPADDDPYQLELRSRMYFAVPGPLTIEGGSGVAISRLGYIGMFMTGGPIEKQGRLRYIDGCTDSLLIPPIVKGTPCLNHLHFPRRISQTRHTHPSIRIGLVVNGSGRCVVPDECGPDIVIPLRPGNLFLIPTNGQHSFFTDDEEMDVIAYHPDSDTGPEHDNHPMINRTIIDGVSAAKIAEIQTPE
jgi:AraC-like ligand binding domain